MKLFFKLFLKKLEQLFCLCRFFKEERGIIGGNLFIRVVCPKCGYIKGAHIFKTKIVK